MTSPDQTPLDVLPSANSDTPVTVESLSFEFGQIAEMAAALRGVDPGNVAALAILADSTLSLIEATNLNLSKLCKGMGQ